MKNNHVWPINKSLPNSVPIRNLANIGTILFPSVLRNMQACKVNIIHATSYAAVTGV